MPVALELGGKSPHLVFADVNVAAAVDAIAEGIFEGSGQSCVAGSRVFVHRSFYATLVEGLVAKAETLRVNMPDHPDAQMGPMASVQQRDHVERMVDGARADGARVLAGRCAPRDAHLARGSFYRPTVIAAVDNNMAVAQQEIFGPVVCVIPFDSEDEAIAMANTSVYGLAAGIWTADYKLAWRVGRAQSKPARCGSTPTNACRSPRLSAGSRRADSAVRKECRACAYISKPRGSTSAWKIGRDQTIDHCRNCSVHCKDMVHENARWAKQGVDAMLEHTRVGRLAAALQG